MSNNDTRNGDKTMKTIATPVIELKLFPRADCGPRHGAREAYIVSLTDALTWKTGTKATGLLPCTDWDKADFRYPLSLHDIACTVAITGRTIQYHGGAAWVRVAVTFVGDGEPDSVVRGWGRVY